MSVPRAFVASVPRGFGDLLAREICEFGGLDVRERGNTVTFTGTLEVAYRICLESRVASRVHLELLRFEAADDPAIYSALRVIDWAAHIDTSGTLACVWSGRHPAISNTHFGVLRLKDAICDSLRDKTGKRPDIATFEPSVRVHAHAAGIRVTVSIDLSGEGLHRRGWRGDTAEAPLRENIAAGILMRAGWPEIAARGGGFIDPMCGGGTFVIEAARMAAGIAPNHRRQYFGFIGWKGHDVALWSRLVETSEARAVAGLVECKAKGLCLIGRDQDRRLLREAVINASRAGVAEITTFEVGELTTVTLPSPRGLLCTNPPWGVRLGDQEAARAVHAKLGTVLRERFGGWEASVLSGDASLGLELGLRAHRVHNVFVGALECRLLRLRVGESAVRDLRPRRGSQIDVLLATQPGAVMFSNRIRKNMKQLSAWLRREGVGCYRLYDADMPEYAFAIDLYTSFDGAERWLVVQEYQAPAQIPEESVRKRRSEALAGLVSATKIPADHVHLRTRRRVRRGDQYTKRGERGEFHVVGEGGLRFRVNFEDYLDTGLFLDHRITRTRLREGSLRKRVLNLFAYTGAATVYAAAGGAASTTTVDLSATYLDWAEANLALNQLSDPRHRFEQADAREWLAAAARRGEHYDLIFCDPPTFSNSKRMEGVLDLQRDHVALIEDCLAVLARGGLLVFTTNAQRFRMDEGLMARLPIRDISRETVPPDFSRNTNIHRAFEIR